MLSSREWLHPPPLSQSSVETLRWSPLPTTQKQIREVRGQTGLEMLFPVLGIRAKMTKL